jgi:copper resistance protein C
VTKGRAALLLVVLAGLLFPTPARAHSELESSRPADGAKLNKPPDHVVLRFSETPSDDSIVTVADGCTKNLVDDSFVAGRAFHVEIVGGTGGRYLVEYSLISAEDGHATKGTFAFNVKGAADCSADEPPEDKNDDSSGNDQKDDADDTAAPGTDPANDEDDSSSPVVPILIGGVAAIVIAVVARLATRR